MNNSTCTICSDYLTINNCTACPCGHTFHYVCIMTWKEHSPTCPQCRVRFKEPIKLFFEISSVDSSELDSASLKNQLTDLQVKMKEKENSMEKLKDQAAVAVNELTVRDQQISTLRQLHESSQETNAALRKQLSYMEKYKTEANRARAEAVELSKSLTSLKNIQKCVQDERHDVEEMLKNMTPNSESMNQIATSYVILKKEFDYLKESKRKLEGEKKTLRKQAESSNREAFECRKKLEAVTEDMNHTNEVNKSLQQKLRKLEQSFASPSPRSSAIKRLLTESPAPFDLKRSRISDILEEDGEQQADGSLILFDGLGDVESCHDDRKEQQSIEVEKALANEFGLNYVCTTSITNARPPLKDRKNINKLNSSNVKPLSSSSAAPSNKASTSLAHMRQGYNGLGGQSKVLVIPKKPPTFVKPAAKLTSRKVKISKPKPTISKLFSSAPKLSVIPISP